MSKATDIELEVRESGLDTQTPPPIGELPAGGGQWPVKHHESKIALINILSRSYRWTFDEATRYSRSDSVAILRDLVVIDALESRFTKTVQLSWHLEADDESDPEQADAVKLLTGVLRRTPRFIDLMRSLLWSTWYGRAGVQLTYEWNYKHPDGKKRLYIKDHRPINGDSLVARWSGDWGVLVGSNFEGEKEQSDGRGYAHFFSKKEAEAVIVHSYYPFDVDFYEPEMAGAIRGLGLRNWVFWSWWLKSNLLALVADYAERFANGIWKAYYDETNPDAKSELSNSLAEYKNSHILLLPRNKATQQASSDVVIEEVSQASPTFLINLIENYFDNLIRRFISGDEHTNDMNVGGDGVGLIEGKIGSTTKLDAVRLAETLSQQLMPVLTRYNCGEHVTPPRFVFDVDSPDAAEVLGYMKAIRELGGDIDLDHAYVVAGIPKPQPGSNISSKLQPMSVVAATTQPQQTPQVGVSGPLPVDPSQQQPQPQQGLQPQQPVVQ